MVKHGFVKLQKPIIQISIMSFIIADLITEMYLFENYQLKEVKRGDATRVKIGHGWTTIEIKITTIFLS